LEDGKRSGELKTTVNLLGRRSWNEFEKVLAWKKAVFSLEEVTGRGHFCQDPVPWHKILLRESEIAGSLVVIEVDDRDPATGLSADLALRKYVVRSSRW
jgi:hypothetical protein